VSSEPSGSSFNALGQSAAMHPARGRRQLSKLSSPKRDIRRGSGILSEDGAELVETALTFSILMMLLIGLIQVTLAVYAFHYVSFAARDATRWAIVRGSNCTGLADCGASNTEIKAHVQNLGYPGIDSANIDTTTTWYTQTWDTGVTPNTAVLTLCGTAPAGCNYPFNQVKVVVTYTLSLNIPFVPSATVPITSTSAMMISQ
jgi:Flp pilus assembly protein TadG